MESNFLFLLLSFAFLELRKLQIDSYSSFDKSSIIDNPQLKVSNKEQDRN